MDKLYKSQVSADCYEKHAFHPLRIESITEQLRLISYFGGENVLEIGVGKGLLKHFLQPFSQVTHTSLDIAEDLNPDHVGSVTEMPFSDNQFDLTLCCQVLEHLPFEDFSIALRELNRVTKDTVIISLPDMRRRFGLGVCLFRFGWQMFEWNFERSAAKNAQLCDEHSWEIGCRGIGFAQVKRCILEAGFRIIRQYRLLKHEWHCFFVLKP